MSILKSIASKYKLHTYLLNHQIQTKEGTYNNIINTTEIQQKTL